MEFIDEKILEYTENHTTSESDLLRQINRETHLEVLQPRMLSGHLQGRFLSLISKIFQPNYIVEIGTYTGYSALCLAEGLQKNGKLITIDINEELEQKVRNYFDSSPYGPQMEIKIGQAADILPSLENDIDLVFIDADKENYPLYYELVLPKMKKGGLIVGDNVLWSGKVIEPIRDKDSSTESIIDFNQMIHDDARVENVLLPIRDGIMVARVL
ncbi:MAG: O-methyltransferase [Bacteroidetes bacterium]|nr:O-methyltransferase [Bacteroidota bacterium]